MSLPAFTDLATMDYSFQGSPFVQVVASTSLLSTSTLDYSFKGQPFYGLALTQKDASFTVAETSSIVFAPAGTKFISLSVNETGTITASDVRNRKVITSVNETSHLTAAAIRSRPIIIEIDETSTITFNDTSTTFVSFEVDETSTLSFSTIRARKIIVPIIEHSTITFAPIRNRLVLFSLTETGTITFTIALPPANTLITWWFPASEFDVDVGKFVTFDVSETSLVEFTPKQDTQISFDIAETSTIQMRTATNAALTISASSNIAVNLIKRKLASTFFVVENSAISLSINKPTSLGIRETSRVTMAVTRRRNAGKNAKSAAFVVHETGVLVEADVRTRRSIAAVRETGAVALAGRRNRHVGFAISEVSAMSLSADSTVAPAIFWSVNETSAITTAVQRSQHSRFAIAEIGATAMSVGRNRHVAFSANETAALAVNGLVTSGSSFTIAETSALIGSSRRNRRIGFGISEFSNISMRTMQNVKFAVRETANIIPLTKRQRKSSAGISETSAISFATQSTSGSILPARIVGNWWFGFGPAVTLGGMMSNAPQYNYASLAVMQSAQSGTGKVQFPQDVETTTQLIADIAAYKASGRVVVFLIAGQGDGGFTLLNTTNANEFYNSIVPLIDQYGVQGIDWDIETGAAGFTPNAMATATSLLKAHYGNNFIIAASPRPFECRSGGIYRQAFALMGSQLDIISPQDYALAGDSLAAQQSYMDGDMADFTVNIAPANKWVIGCFDPGEGESTTTSLATWNHYVGVYPSLRGVCFWTSENDRSQTNYAFATGIATSTSIQQTFTAGIGGTCTTALHGYVTACGAYRVTTTGSLPGGLVANTDYCVISLSDNTFHFATNRANALAGTFINLSSTGSGTHTLHA